MKKLSVVMPVYNVSEYLYHSIESIQKQTLQDIEVICVNDGSTDNSVEVLKEIGKKYDKITVINQENSGPGVARNTGIEHATGEYIAFLDADDIFLDECALEKMYNLAKKHESNMVGANLKWINPDYSIDKYYDYINSKFTYFYKEDMLAPEEYGIPFAFYKNIYKNSFIKENNISFPDIRSGEDPVFMANVLANLEEFPVINMDLYGYNHSLGGGVNEKINSYEKKYSYIKHFKDVFEILKKNGYDSVLSIYKIEFMNYLIYSDNLQDTEIQEITRELFNNYKDYFDKKDYGYFILDYLNDNSINSPKNDEYNLIKKCLFEESCIEDNTIHLSRLQEYLKFSENKISDDKISYDKCSFEELNVISSVTQDANKNLTGEVKELRHELTRDIYDRNSEFLRKYSEARIDIKNMGTSDNDVELVGAIDSLYHIYKPKWFKDSKGNGTVITSIDDNVKLSFKCVNDGNLVLSFRGVDFKDKNDTRIPIYIDYSSIIVDGVKLINDSTVVSHDDFFTYEKDVTDGQIVTIEADWTPLNLKSNLHVRSDFDKIVDLFSTCRIDFKNYGIKSNQISIEYCNDPYCFIEEPNWFKDRQGIGTKIESRLGLLNFSIKCVNDGFLEIKFRGVDFRDRNWKRIPIFVDYESIKIDGEEILKENKILWHDDSFVYNKKVSNDQEINFEVKWKALNKHSTLNIINDNDIIPRRKREKQMLKDLKEELKILENENTRLKTLKDELLNSNSWKTTQIFRKFKNINK